MRALFLGCWLLNSAGFLSAQQLTTAGNPSGRKLAFLIPGFLEDTLQQIRQIAPSLEAPIRVSVTPSLNLASFNSAVATELSNLPVPSPASGLRYTLDPALGIYVPSAQSLGPILAERAETIGRNKFFFAVTYQRFQFDRLDALDLRNITFRIPVPIGGATGIIEAQSYLSLNVTQTTAHFSYGLTHWLDASYALPIVTSTLVFGTQGSFGFAPGQALLSFPQTPLRGRATGLGDGLVRLKAKLLDIGAFRFGFGTDVRIPTGDEFNYHGAGAYGVKPFLITSLSSKSVSPHVNAGYQWNGKSFLGSDTGTEKQRLPGQIFYTAGIDTSISHRFTLAFDVLDQIVVHGRRTFLDTPTIGGTTFATAAFPNLTRHEVNAAAGFKARLGRDVILTANLLFRLNHAGLRSRVVPLAGVSYLY